MLCNRRIPRTANRIWIQVIGGCCCWLRLELASSCCGNPAEFPRSQTDCVLLLDLLRRLVVSDAEFPSLIIKRNHRWVTSRRRQLSSPSILVQRLN